MSTTRVPPHDLDAEAAVLSACMLDEAVCDDLIPLVAPEDFYSEPHRRIFEACVTLRSANERVDMVQVGSWLKSRDRIAQVGGMSYLAEILDAAPVVHHAESYARTVRDKARVRTLIAACQKIAAQGYLDYGTAQTFIDDAAQTVNTVADDVTVAGSLKPLLDLVKENVRAMVAARETSEQQLGGIPTGLAALDAILSGLRGSQNIVIAGRPGMGKSALGTGLGVNVAQQGHGVLIVSAEMAGREITDRLLSQAAGVNSRRVRQGLLTAGEYANFMTGAQRMGALPIWVEDRPSTLIHLRSKARRVARECKAKGIDLKLIVVDYLQLLQGSASARDGNREQEISDLSRGMKALSKEFDCTVLTLSQLNRAVETRPSKRPLLSDLRESGSIEQDADAVLLVYRPDYYDASASPGLVEVNVAKHRGGPTGIAYSWFTKHTTSFRDLTPQEAQSLGVVDDQGAAA